MEIIHSIPALRKKIQSQKNKGKTVGFVPTMGAFHKGHLSLMKKSCSENDLTVVSIFVNPIQFGPREDFKSYPRPKQNDCALAKREDVDILFYPSAHEMYPEGYETYIAPSKNLTDTLCGKSRPGHFKGVTTVVGKLLNIVNPDIMYLGQKDAQQCIIIKQMVDDLNFPVKVKILPTHRESDGLAMSSRNQYLRPQERTEAPILYRALKIAQRCARNGEVNSSKITSIVRREITKNTSAKIDYIQCVNPRTLKSTAYCKKNTLIAIAVKFSKARLIDNIFV